MINQAMINLDRINQGVIERGQLLLALKKGLGEGESGEVSLDKRPCFKKLYKKLSQGNRELAGHIVNRSQEVLRLMEKERRLVECLCYYLRNRSPIISSVDPHWQKRVATEGKKVVLLLEEAMVDEALNINRQFEENLNEHLKEMGFRKI